MVGEMTSSILRIPTQTRIGAEESIRRDVVAFHHIIEIGAASFFLVRQFLKRLEGERVLTLMAAMLPYMSGVCRISGPGRHGRACRCSAASSARYQGILQTQR